MLQDFKSVSDHFRVLCIKGFKHHCITKRIHKLLSGNSRSVIYILLKQLIYHTDITNRSLFVAEIVETLDLNNFGWPDGFATVF